MNDLDSNFMSRRRLRSAIAQRAEDEGWHVCEGARMGGRSIDLLLSKSIVVAVRIASAPVTDTCVMNLEAATVEMGCHAVLVDTDSPQTGTESTGRVIVVPPATVRLYLHSDMDFLGLLSRAEPQP